MSSRPFLAVSVAALVCCAPSAANAVPAVGTVMPTAIIGVPNSPIVLSSCRIEKTGDYTNSWVVNVVIGNRTKHVMPEASIAFVSYDVENTRIQQQTVKAEFDQPVTSRDSAPSRMAVGFNGDQALISHVACRVQSATFSANKTWSYGQTWPEKNLTLMKDDMGVVQGGGGAVPPQKAAVPRAQISVTNAWVDTINGVTFVHDALAITGGNTDSQLRGSDFLLAATLTNGARKTYAGLTQAAPTYQKLNPLGSQTTTAYEVEPNSDLGRLGTITVPAHASVTTTVTFGTSDPVNTGDIRTVTLK